MKRSPDNSKYASAQTSHAGDQVLLPPQSDLKLLSSNTGHEFLQTFVDLLQEVTQVDFIAISELRMMEKEKIQVKAGWMDGESS